MEVDEHRDKLSSEMRNRREQNRARKLRAVAMGRVLLFHTLRDAAHMH